jgi:hypothetical protein
VLLALGVLFAQQSKPDALFIDQNGQVGINQTRPESPLDVNGKALFRGPIQVNGDASVGGKMGSKTLDVKESAYVGSDLSVNGKLVSAGAIEAGNSALYFTKTDHTWSAAADKKEGLAAIENSKDFNLAIAGRTTTGGTRVVSMWDRVGIGKVSPQAPLDVRGEIRGKPWISEEYVWKQKGYENSTGEPTRMTKKDRSVCFLTYVSGYFNGEGEAVEIKAVGDYWVLTGKSAKYHVQAKARCIGAPDNSW